MTSSLHHQTHPAEDPYNSLRLSDKGERIKGSTSLPCPIRLETIHPEHVLCPRPVLLYPLHYHLRHHNQAQSTQILVGQGSPTSLHVLQSSVVQLIKLVWVCLWICCYVCV